MTVGIALKMVSECIHEAPLASGVALRGVAPALKFVVLKSEYLARLTRRR